jgi:molecular chaperone Hsp33
MSNTDSYGEFPNKFQSFSIEDSNIRGGIVRLGQSYADILGSHQYPSQVAILMGELAVMAVALANFIKYDGLFSLQTRGNGPITTMVVDVTSAGTLRGYAHFDKKQFVQKKNKFLIPHLMGNGHFAFTVDQGKGTKCYQGITSLDGATLSECAQNYFRESEQLDTAVLLTADPQTKKAAALIIQKMPNSSDRSQKHFSPTLEEDDEKWRNAVIIMSSITTQELLNPSIQTNDLLYRLYHENGVRIYDKKLIKFQCRCSSKKIIAALASFPAKELNNMKTSQGSIVATCEFCLTAYEYDDKAINIERNSQISIK